MNSIQEAVEKATGGAKTDEEKMERIFYFVRDEILFGFSNKYYHASAEEVLKKQRGICLNKAELLVAMIRETGMSARFHYSWVSPNCLIDLIHPLFLKNLPDPFLHIYAEVLLSGRWVSMDVIFDRRLHKAILKKGSTSHDILKKGILLLNSHPPVS